MVFIFLLYRISFDTFPMAAAMITEKIMINGRSGAHAENAEDFPKVFRFFSGLTHRTKSRWKRWPKSEHNPQKKKNDYTKFMADDFSRAFETVCRLIRRRKNRSPIHVYDTCNVVHTWTMPPPVSDSLREKRVRNVLHKTLVNGVTERKIHQEK